MRDVPFPIFVLFLYRFPHRVTLVLQLAGGLYSHTNFMPAWNWNRCSHTPRRGLTVFKRCRIYPSCDQQRILRAYHYVCARSYVSVSLSVPAHMRRAGSSVTMYAPTHELHADIIEIDFSTRASSLSHFQWCWWHLFIGIKFCFFVLHSSGVHWSRWSFAQVYLSLRSVKFCAIV